MATTVFIQYVPLQVNVGWLKIAIGRGFICKRNRDHSEFRADGRLFCGHMTYITECGASSELLRAQVSRGSVPISGNSGRPDNFRPALQYWKVMGQTSNRYRAKRYGLDD